MRKPILLLTIITICTLFYTGCKGSTAPDSVKEVPTTETIIVDSITTETETESLPSEDGNFISAYKYSELERVLIKIKDATK